MSKKIAKIAAYIFAVSVTIGTAIVATLICFLMSGNNFSSFIATLLLAIGIFASVVVLQTAYEKEVANGLHN